MLIKIWPKGGYVPLTVSHLNLNSVWLDDFAKLSQISTYLSVHKFDILCLSETFLDSSILDDDPRLAIDGYNLIRFDHPSNSKKGGVCIYFKDHLPLVCRADLTNLHECLMCELRACNKRLFFTVIYRSPSQTLDQFSFFKQKWEETIVNNNKCSPFISLYVGDFNARNSDCGQMISETPTVLRLMSWLCSMV